MKNPCRSAAIFAAACGVICPGASPAQYEAVPRSGRWHPAEILAWSPAADPDAPYNRATVPLAPRFTAPPAAADAALHALWNVNPHARPGEARVQAVTTFNTIPAGAPNGWRTTRLYAPGIWQYTDNMVFWGSSDRDTKTILCPTAHMIDAAHRNGVPIYGKIFFHWNSSPDNAALQRIRDLIRKNGPVFPVADKLVEAAMYYGFDGWFINQENYQTNAADAQNMRDFMAYFRTRAAALGAPHLKIIWYDAMAENGSRSFQNALTDRNDGFLKSGAAVTDTGNTLAAHGMFLNFWWYYQAENLRDSRSLALSRGIDPYDLHAGIWTENYRSYGKTPDPGGGGNIDIAWPYLFPEGEPHHTSVALFGGETPFVKGSTPATVAAQEEIYWSGPNRDPSDTVPAAGSATPNWYGLAHFIPANSPVTALPFVTHFNAGQGNFYKIGGATVMTGPWTNLGVQDILPTWRWIVRGSGAKTLTPSIDFTEAYHGGSSLKAAGSLEANLPQELKLYQTRLTLEADTKLGLIYKPAAVNGARIQAGYAFADAPGVMHYTAPLAAGSTSWTAAEFPLGSHAGRTLALITLRFSSTGAIPEYSVNIGRVSIGRSPGAPPPPPSGLVLEGKSRNPDEALSTSLRLKWTPSSSPVLHYNVYHRKDATAAAPRVWVGATPNHYFFAQDVRRFGSEETGTIEVEAVGPDHAVSPPADVAFAFESLPNLHHPFIAAYPPEAPLAVIGSGEAANMARAFDNDPGTHTEPGGASGAWVGLDLGEGNARQVTAVRFVPRNNWASRMVNGVFQGSNTADFSSGVVELARVNALPPQGAATTLRVNQGGAFRYVRYLSPDGGYANVAEIRFFGAGAPAPPSAPLSLQATHSGTTADLSWRPPASGIAYGYDVKRSTANGGPYSIVAADLGGTSFRDNGLVPGAAYYYVVSARNEAGEGPGSDRLVLNPPAATRLTGTVIGTDGSWDGTSTKFRVFDNLLSTYFDSPQANGSWAGLDLGSPRKITALRYSPRNSTPNWLGRMTGGRFQAADNPSFQNAATLFTVPAAPEYNVLTTAAVGGQGLYRYVRYLSPDGGHCNISEAQFHGVPIPAAPGGLELETTAEGSRLEWDPVPAAIRYRVKRSGQSGGPYQTAGEPAEGTVFEDSVPDPGAIYYYVVSAVNEAGEGPDSAERIRADAYQSWILASGGQPDAAESGFGGDLDGDGMPNGVEYMVPAGLVPFAGAESRGLSAILRHDPAVTVKLWVSGDLAEWSQVSFAESADQSGVESGFRRVERRSVPEPGEQRIFYRFEFSR